MKKRRQDKKLLIAEEEVLLSKERTILSFMRTALAFIGVGIIVVNFFKDTAFQLIGYLLIMVGFVEIGESARRLRKKQKIMGRLEKRTGV
ncbi:MAG: DUF202 domain-containing protein [Candidatus Aenigmarchaeota archaeon]|nr:DUF202 domain-containing protein [Candidatus Aenigmarchaeota archaeon]